MQKFVIGDFAALSLNRILYESPQKLFIKQRNKLEVLFGAYLDFRLYALEQESMVATYYLFNGGRSLKIT